MPSPANLSIFHLGLVNPKTRFWYLFSNLVGLDYAIVSFNYSYILCIPFKNSKHTPYNSTH